MNATCQVTQRTSNRICLSVPGAAAQPDTSQYLAQVVLQLPGVAGVEIWPASESLVILHSGGRPTGDAILNALRGQQPPPEDVPSGADAGRVSGTVEQLPYARYEVLHAMRGRVRLHIPVLRTEQALAGALSCYLSQQPGIKTVRLNRLAANVVVAFDPTDPAVLDAQAIVAMVAAYNPTPAEIEHWRTFQNAAALDMGQRRSRQKIELALALAALALPIFFGAAAALLAYALLWGSIASILERTFRWVFKDRRATLDALAAAAMGMLVLSGLLWQAALIPAAFVGIAWLRSRVPAQPGKQAEQDELVIALPAKKVRTAPAGVVAPAGAATAATGASNPLSSSILGGLAMWVASRSLLRSPKKAGQ
jgi:hypothetical protein